jgi:hypothetical protein
VGLRLCTALVLLMTNVVIFTLLYVVYVLLNIIISNSIIEFNYEQIKNKIVFLKQFNIYVDMKRKTYYGKMITKEIASQMYYLKFKYSQITKPINQTILYFTGFGVVVKEYDIVNMKYHYYINNEIILKVDDAKRKYFELLILPFNQLENTLVCFLNNFNKTLIPTTLTVNEITNYLMMSKAVKEVMSLEQLLDEYYTVRIKPPLNMPKIGQSYSKLNSNLTTVFLSMKVPYITEILKEFGFMRGPLNYDRLEIRNIMYDKMFTISKPLLKQRNSINVLITFLVVIFSFLPYYLKVIIFIANALTGKTDFLFKVLFED